MREKVIIIGSGFGGLGAAARLAARGFDVELRAEGHSIWTARRMGYGGGISPAEMLFRHGLMLGPKQAASLDAGLGSAGVRGIVFAVQPYE